MQLQKGYGIRNSIPKGASTRTRLRVNRFERKIHECILIDMNFMEVRKNMERAVERYKHLLE